MRQFLRWLWITGISLASLLPCSSNAEDYVRLSAYYSHDKPLFCFEVPVERVRKLPVWNGSGEPPLPRAQAVEIGRRELGLPDQASPWSIELNKIEISYFSFKGNVWYYLIDYAASTKDASATRTDRNVAVVLLDGTSVSKTDGNCTHRQP